MNIKNKPGRKKNPDRKSNVPAKHPDTGPLLKPVVREEPNPSGNKDNKPEEQISGSGTEPVTKG